MNKVKQFDQALKVIFYFFLILACTSIIVGAYEKLFDDAKSLNISSAYTFLLMAFLARYYYAIIYWAKRLEQVNTAERERQLRMEKNQ